MRWYEGLTYTPPFEIVSNIMLPRWLTWRMLKVARWLVRHATQCRNHSRRTRCIGNEIHNDILIVEALMTPPRVIAKAEAKQR